MIKQTPALYYATCDTEDCDPDEAFDEYVPYYETRERALAGAVKYFGFTQFDDGTLLCRAHSARRQCDEQGHDWEPWRDCYCNGLVPEHADQCRQQRWCLRCSDLDPDGEPCPQQDPPHVPAPLAVGDPAGQLVELWNAANAHALAGLQGLTLYRHTDDGWQPMGGE